MSEAALQADPNPPAPPPAGANPPAPATPPAPAPNGNGKTPPLAAGVDPAAPPAPEDKPYWPDDWKQRVADYVGAGNKKQVEKELRRLENINDPTAIYANFRTLENTWASRKFVKLPGEDAKPEEIAEYHKALGVPEKPEDYLKEYKPANGAVLGDADKPVAEVFVSAMHRAGAPPAAVHAALDWYLNNMEQQAAQLDEMDDRFRREAETALKNDFGHAFQRKTNSISSLFKAAPGGVDATNPQSVFARLMGGRTADGKIIGNDPDIVRWMIAVNQEVNPGASIVEDGDNGIQSMETQIASIEKRMREDRRGYDKDYAQQEKYRQLLEARTKIQTRQRA